jgi:hypothetical protein
VTDEFDDVMARARARLEMLDRATDRLAEPPRRPSSDAEQTARTRRVLDEVVEDLAR